MDIGTNPGVGLSKEIKESGLAATDEDLDLVSSCKKGDLDAF
jgi:hypothetical protein